MSKYKTLCIIFDILSILLSYFTLNLFILKGNISNKFYFLILFVILTLISNLFTEDYVDIYIRGYLKEIKYSVAFAVRITIIYLILLLIRPNNTILNFELVKISTIFYFFIILIFYIYTFRIIIKSLKRKIYKNKIPILVVSTFSDENNLNKFLDWGYEIKGYINFKTEEDNLDGKIVLKNVEQIKHFIAKNRIDEIFITSSSYADFKNLLTPLKILGIKINIDIEGFSSQFVGDLSVKNIEDKLFLTSVIRERSTRDLILKRIVDIVGGLVGTIIMLIVAIIIYPRVQKESKGPLIFKQKRVGKNGKIFNMYKFRSMYLDAEERKKDLINQNELNTNLMFKIKDDPRIFPFGKILRKTSLDELPQFINVLKGDMSLVGTRPPTVDEYENYELHHFKRLSVKPGITGIWQVSGRSNIEDFEKVIELDLKYIQNWSINMDIKLLFKTIKVVLKREGSM